METQHINPKVDPNTHILQHLVASCFPTTHLYPQSILDGKVLLFSFSDFKLCFYGPNSRVKSIRFNSQNSSINGKRQDHFNTFCLLSDH